MINGLLPSETSKTDTVGNKNVNNLDTFIPIVSEEFENTNDKSEQEAHHNEEILIDVP